MMDRISGGDGRGAPENPEILKAWVAWASQCFVLGLICHHHLESDDVSSEVWL